MSFTSRLRIPRRALVALTFALFVHAAPAQAADPMKVGLSLSLTGAVASNGKQILMALELWRDDVNAAQALPGQGGGTGSRSARPWLRAVRLCGRPGSRQGGARNQEHRSGQARRLHP